MLRIVAVRKQLRKFSVQFHMLKASHFFMRDGHYSGKQQMSLCSLLRDMGSVDIQSIKFHFDRGDFQKWLRTTIGDEDLARTFDQLDKTTPEEDLPEKLAILVQKRISELQLTH